MAIPRRGFLGALALAPAALAGCRATSSASAGGDRAGASAPAGPKPPGGPLAVVRDFPLDERVEPAFVFRAVAARPGES